MDQKRDRTMCVLAPDGKSNDARVYIEETGECLSGVESVDYHLDADPGHSRIVVTILPEMATFYSGQVACDVKKNMDRLYAHRLNHRNMRRLGIGRIH